MTRTTWRILRTEVLRGAAPIAALAMAAAGLPLLFNNSIEWAGRWAPLAETVRLTLLVLVPLVVTAAAWQAGRERRRRLGDQLRTSARPGWQPILVAWASVTIGSSVAVVLIWLPGVVVVAPVATYGGRGWWWTLVVAFAALGAASALGVAAGRVLPFRVTAPLAGVATLLMLQSVTWRADGLRWLAPPIDPMGGTHYLGNGFHVLQFGWFAGLGAAMLMAVSVRRRWLALGPAVVAAVAGTALAVGPHDRWEPDLAAQELTCSDATPHVCLTQVNAFLAGDAVPLIEERLGQWNGVAGAPTRIVDSAARAGDLGDGVVELQLWPFITWRGGLADSDRYGGPLDDRIARAVLDYEGEHVCHVDQAGAARDVALRWAGGNPYQYWVGEDGEPIEPPADPALDHLQAMPEDAQRDWMSRYLHAERECDVVALGDLVAELQ